MKKKKRKQTKLKFGIFFNLFDESCLTFSFDVPFVDSLVSILLCMDEDFRVCVSVRLAIISFRNIYTS